MGQPAVETEPSFKESVKSPLQWLGVLFIGGFLALVFGIWFCTYGGLPNYFEFQRSFTSASILSDAMVQYARNHDVRIPPGASSTEVFQHLIDENYIHDPTVFWRDLPGKVKATSNQLKPENVAWDVTSPVDNSSHFWLPILFPTGYRVEYIAQGCAIPLDPVKGRTQAGIFVLSHGELCQFRKTGSASNGLVPNFVDEGFLPTPGVTYRQLTPDGPLAPEPASSP